MASIDPTRVELFLTIGVPLLPILWIVVAVQTTWLRNSFGSAVDEMNLGRGTRHTRRIARAGMFALAISMCLVFGVVVEWYALAMILFGSQTELAVSAWLLFVALLVTSGLGARAMYRRLVSPVNFSDPRRLLT